MEATFKLRVSELDTNVLEHIKKLFAGKSDAVITISVEEIDASYSEELYRSRSDLENRNNLISFTMEELEAYTASKKP